MSTDRKEINRAELNGDIKIPVVFKINTSDLSMMGIKKESVFFLLAVLIHSKTVILKPVQLRQFYYLCNGMEMYLTTSAEWFEV